MYDVIPKRIRCVMPYCVQASLPLDDAWTVIVLGREYMPLGVFSRKPFPHMRRPSTRMLKSWTDPLNEQLEEKRDDRGRLIGFELWLYCDGSIPEVAGEMLTGYAKRLAGFGRWLEQQRFPQARET